jgi:hypothetical protein
MEHEFSKKFSWTKQILSGEKNLRASIFVVQEILCRPTKKCVVLPNFLCFA